MVFHCLFSILGGTSYCPQAHGMFPLFCNDRHSPPSSLRYFRSKLPSTPTQFYLINYRAYFSSSYCAPEETCTPLSITRQSSRSSTSSSQALRKGSLCFDQRLRFQTRR